MILIGPATPKLASADVTRHLPRLTAVIPPDEVARAHYLARRLQVALFDLGFDRIVPGGWVTPAADGLAFGHLTLRQGDALAIGLEDVLTIRSSAPSSPVAGQLPLFEGGLR